MAINDVKVKAKIQNLLNKNTVMAGGDFHSDVLDDSSFIYDLEKICKLTPTEDCKSNCELLQEVIKSSTVKVRGMINSKELKQSKFFKDLFNSFEIEMI
jgi:hypothetical protein